MFDSVEETPRKKKAAPVDDDTIAEDDDYDNDNNNTTTTSQQLSTSISVIQKQLADYKCTQKGVTHLNILLIGEKGAGKSSLLSTFYRCLNSGTVNLGAPVAGVGTKKAEAFTKKYKGYKLNAAGTLMGHDTRGLESFLKNEIEHVKAIRDGKIMEGSVVKQKSNWNLWDYMYSMISRNPAVILDPDCLKDGPITLQDLPHAVIFVVPANQRIFPKELGNFVTLFTEYGYDPLFAVTKIDCHGSTSGDLYAATHLYDSKKQQLIQMFELEYEQVRPIQNYTQWEKREASIENLAIDLLSRAVRAAEMFVANYDAQKNTKANSGIISSVYNSCIIS